jgi:hypothetical protein
MRAACGRNRRCPTPTPALEWHIRPIKRGFQVFVVREDRLEGEQTRSLLAMHLAELYANSPPGGVFALDDTENGIGARIAAALVSLNGHNRIRRQPISVGRVSRSFNLWKGKL